jgi:anti-sigma factor RsiW
MGKLDIGVGDEFPVDEPPPRSPEDDESARAAREEWDRQKDEWRARKAEWRAQREAWRADRDAFKADVRKSFREHFGSRGFRGLRGVNGFLPRLLIGFGLIALAIALLPFLFMFGFLALAVVLMAAGLRGGRHDYRPGNPSQTS